MPALDFSNMHPEQMLTTQEVADIMRVSTDTLEGYRSRRNKDGNLIGGGPPFKKRGQWVRYRWADFVAWRDQNDKQPSTA